MASSVPKTETGRNMCLDIRVDLNIYCSKDEVDVEASPEGLLDLVDRYKRRSQPNIKLPLEVNLGINGEPKVVFVGAKLIQDLKNQMSTLLNDFKDYLLSVMRMGLVST